MHKKELPDLSLCSLCGTCKALCPTYEGRLTEGMSARGRLKLIKGLLDGDLQPTALLDERLFSCLLCGSCSCVCPLGIDIPEAIYHARHLLKDTDKKRRLLRYLFKFSARWPDLSFRIISMTQDFVIPLLAKRNIIPFSPELPDQPFLTIEQVHKVPKKKGRVAIFTGCSVNYLFPHLGESLINVLQSLGYEVVLPKDEVCCGAPLRELGMEEEALELAKTNHKVFSRLKVEAVLSLCPTCTMTLKHGYEALTGRGIEKAVDISVFLRERLGHVEAIDRSVTYHDPCHLKHSLGIRKEPREIISNAGLRLIESASEGCCGFGGTFCISFKDMSDRLLQSQALGLLDTGAEAVVTSCPGCMLQLRRTIHDRPVIHLIELIEEAYCLRSLYQEPVLGAKV